MLNNDALAQLRQLKQTIHDSKDRGEGIVKGSQGRFGFVALDDGREIYLPPEHMQRVFPDDRVAVEVVTGNEGKPAAQLERLIESPLRVFTGRYVVRDNAHFVEPDLPRLTRWIFVPPKLRRPSKHETHPQKSAHPQHGDWVRACIAQHPYNDGKPQARIEAIIGGDNQKGIEARYALARFELPDSAPVLNESDLAQPDAQTRRDLTALPFITIDGADTRDMDDALHAQSSIDDDNANSARWKLTVAIADPGAWIKAGSAFEKIIAARGTSVYLPGLSVPMLPEQLANERCSLLPDAERLAVVCEMWIDETGHIARYEFSEARIRSRAKLSYERADELLRSKDCGGETNAWNDSLHALAAVSKALQQQREREHILLPERPEYRAQFDENGKAASYQRQIKNAAHQLVEECMVATNRCAGNFLKNNEAVFVTHAGFRSDRGENVNKLLAAELPAFFNPAPAKRNVYALNDYIALMQTVGALKNELPLREILTRSLERSQFSANALPHFGMGLECYATLTSPIRKFNDYLTQRALKAKLSGKPCPSIGADTIAQLQNISERARQAANFAQQWLDSDYLSKQPRKTWTGTIVHVTSSGLLVRLNENGIQGFVDTRHSGEKFSFDSVYMRLKSPTRSYQLDQQVEVSVGSIDAKKHQIALQIAGEKSAANASAANESVSDVGGSIVTE